MLFVLPDFTLIGQTIKETEGRRPGNPRLSNVVTFVNFATVVSVRSHDLKFATYMRENDSHHSL